MIKIRDFVFYQHDMLAFLLACIFFAFFAEQISAVAVSQDWSESDLYGSIFGWSAIQTGFFFGVYTFVVARPGKFRDNMKDNTAFAEAMTHLRATVYMLFIFSMVSAPLTFFAPNIKAVTSWKTLSIGYVFFAVICCISLYLAGRVLMAIRTFMIVETGSTAPSSKRGRRRK